jgi:predicted nucleic acid-binding protein
MALTVSDTDVVIDYIDRKVAPSGAFMSLLMADELAITSVTVYELMFGAQERGRAETEAFIKRVPVLPLTWSGAAIAAVHGSRLSAAGNMIPIQDLLIAGVALDHELPLMTRNVRHFGRIGELALQDPD